MDLIEKMGGERNLSENKTVLIIFTDTIIAKEISIKLKAFIGDPSDKPLEGAILFPGKNKFTCLLSLPSLEISHWESITGAYGSDLSIDYLIFYDLLEVILILSLFILYNIAKLD